MTTHRLRLTLGGLPFEILPDGRVLVTLPATMLPFGAALSVTVLYPSLRTFSVGMRRDREVPAAPGGAAMHRPIRARPEPTRGLRVGPRCTSCGEETLVAPCAWPGCEWWAFVCWGCPGVAERYIEANGHCARYRVVCPVS